MIIFLHFRKQFHPDQESVSGYVVFKKESAANDALNRCVNKV